MSITLEQKNECLPDFPFVYVGVTQAEIDAVTDQDKWVSSIDGTVCLACYNAVPALTSKLFS